MKPPNSTLDALVVGAGPTGLTLAAQLNRFGATFRIVDRALDRVHESRALGVQARSIEIFQQLGLGDALVARGNRSAKITLHVEGRAAATASLSDFGAADTRYPYILFVSQAETENLLNEHLASHRVIVDRGVELVSFVEDSSGVSCVLRHPDGREEQVVTQYLVGCDGAHSTVRRGAGIAFEGDAYLQDFMLGDVEADSAPNVRLIDDSIHPFVGSKGIAVFFPLGRPTTWRVIAMSSRAATTSRRGPGAPDQPITGALSLAELQTTVDGATGGGLRVHSPAWMTHFRLHHRQAAHYRRRRVFLAGDAAHIHSPVGAQGMNTGIQDAWNLGWKLAMVARRGAGERLLDTYEAERWPVGRTLLRYTDRAFGLLVRSLSPGVFSSWLRRTVPARIIPLVLKSKRLRTRAFRFVSELDIHYRRSPAVLEATPRLASGPRAGDRMPDAPVVKDGRRTFLHEGIGGARFHLLLCGAVNGWDAAEVRAMSEAFADAVSVLHLTTRGSTSQLIDADGTALARLGVRDWAQYLVRPDGYIAYRCAGLDLAGVSEYLRSFVAT